MTQSELMTAIKLLHPMLTCRYHAEYREYRVRFRDYHADTTYFTDDRDDAFDTACAMTAERRNNENTHAFDAMLPCKCDHCNDIVF